LETEPARAFHSLIFLPDPISLAVIGAIVGEFISGRSGLGYLVLSANNYFNTPMAFTALLYLVLMWLALYGLVIVAEKLILPWSRREAG
jgi:NitT/TauT family transport system permease protein